MSDHSKLKTERAAWNSSLKQQEIWALDKNVSMLKGCIECKQFENVRRAIITQADT